ncbi:MAG: YdcF family protein [Melioribacter sp.]|nr:YdcF family protein [Melioribacter sp.]
MAKKSLRNNFLLISLILSILYLIGLSFLKYYTNGLSIKNYSFRYLGNIVNIVFSGLLFIGILVANFKEKNFKPAQKKFIVFLLVIANFLLVLVYLSSEFFVYDQSSYLFSFQIKKVYTGFFYILSFLIIIYVVLYIWGAIFFIEKLHELRTIVRTIFVVMLLIIVSIFYVWDVKKYSYKRDDFVQYEIAMIPGAAVWSKNKPSPIFEGRIRKAFEMYQEKRLKRIIVTGGNAPGEVSEAEAAFILLTRLGVPNKDLIVENKSSTTTEQIKYLKSLEDSLANKKILIVSDSFHLPRIMQICKFFHVKAEAIASDYKLLFSKTLYYRFREAIALLLFWLFAI